MPEQIEMPVSEILTSSVPPEASAPASEKPAADEAPPAEGATKPRSEAPKEPEDVARMKRALSSVQKRIDSVVRESNDKVEFERYQRGILEQKLADAEARAQAAAQGAQPPRLEDFKTIDEFTRATAEFVANRVKDDTLTAERQRAAKAEADQRMAAQQNAAVARYQQVVESKIAEAVKKYPDFVETVTGPEVPSMRGTPAFDAALESEHGADIFYYLGKNPQKVHELLTLSPMGQIREIGRIEVAVASGKTVTAAPPPVATVSGSAAGATRRSIADPNLSYDEFVRLRRDARRKR